ncbi:MAG: DNA-directed RNA polymerase subunit omega [Sphingobacteriales bacterium]|nr:MAG: DNA-directed RNA polymerase subunit omega [Sphingobacteriales bacterium]
MSIQRKSVNPIAVTRDVVAMKDKTGNLYESIAIIARRANQISVQMKGELQKKLEEFSSISEHIEEVNENKEQIEISRAYERLANPALQATAEFFEDEIHYRKK